MHGKRKVKRARELELDTTAARDREVGGRGGDKPCGDLAMRGAGKCASPREYRGDRLPRKSGYRIEWYAGRDIYSE
jgi:hypothetical protein